VTTASTVYATPAHALVSGTFRVPGNGLDRLGRQFVGQVRIRVTASEPSRPVFVGIAPARTVAGYLSGVSYTRVRDIGSARSTEVLTPGSAVPAAPGSMAIWAAKSAGTGTRVIVMTLHAGNWAVVVMNPDAAPGLSVRADIGATAPIMPWVAGAMLAAGALTLAGAVLLIVVPVRRAGR